MDRFVDNGAKAVFRYGFGRGACGVKCALLKVFTVVGEVADRVSNLRLVAFFPKIGVMFEVFRLSFGRFEAGSVVGFKVLHGVEDSTARDIVGDAW